MQPGSGISPIEIELPFDHFLPSNNEQSRGTLLFAYGGSEEPNFRRKVKPLAEMLSILGLRVITFDYRSNKQGADFNAFGVHDRIEDTKIAIGYMKTLGEPPFSILGLSMGGHIAVRAAAETDNGKFFKNIILIAPAAYPEAATRPGVLFGQGEGRFGNLIRKKWEPMISDAHKAAETIDARLLLIRYEQDNKVDGVFSGPYLSGFGLRNGNGEKPDKKLISIPGDHSGTLTNPKKMGLLIEAIDNFTAAR